MIKKVLVSIVFAMMSLNVLAVEITEAKARATFALAKTGAVYLSIKNVNTAPITLVSVTVSEDVADSAEIHTTVMVEDMLRMQELENGLVIEGNGVTAMAPGKEHIMLLGLKGPLEAGETLALTLHFDDGSNINVTANIVDMKKSGGHHHHHH